MLVAFVKFYPKGGLESRVFVGTATLAVVFTLLVFSLPFIAVFFRSLSRQKIMYHEEKLERARNLLNSINHGGSVNSNV